TTSAGNFVSRITGPLIFASVLPIAFFAPHQTTDAQSYGECLSLSLNLMFIGSVVSSTLMMLGRPFRFSAPEFGTGGQMPPPDLTDTVGAAGNQVGRNPRGSRECERGCCDCCDFR